MLSAVILAAGEGKKAWPYSGIRQKVTLPVLNMPIIRLMALCAIQSGADEVIVVTGRHTQAIRACLSDLDNVKCIKQDTCSGTADAALTGISVAQFENILLCFGDIVTTQPNIQHLLEKYNAEKCDAQLLATRYLFGATLAAHIRTDRSGQVTGVFYETANKNMRYYGGVAVIKKSLLESSLLQNPGLTQNTSGPMPSLEADLVCSLNILCESGAEVGYLDCCDFLVDVDKPWQLAEANAQASRHLFKNLPPGINVANGAHISEKATIASNVKVSLGPNARIGDYCRIESSLILEEGACLENGVCIQPGGGVILGKHACTEDFSLLVGPSIIGAHSYIGHGADFMGITFEKVSIRHPAQICAVLGNMTNIAGGTMTSNWRFDNGVREQRTGKHREKPEKYGELTFLGDHVRTGNNVVFSPGIKVGSYSCIGSGIWVNEDVPDKSLLLLKQEVIRKEWGPERFGW